MKTSVYKVYYNGQILYVSNSYKRCQNFIERRGLVDDENNVLDIVEY